MAATAEEAGARAPDMLAYAVGAAGVAALLARRRWPVGVLAATVVALGAYGLLDYPAGRPSWRWSRRCTAPRAPGTCLLRLPPEGW